MNKTNRRSFLKIYGTVATGAFVVPTIIPACARGKNGHTAPSDRVNMAFIGAGNQAGNDVKEFLKERDRSKEASLTYERAIEIAETYVTK